VSFCEMCSLTVARLCCTLSAVAQPLQPFLRTQINWQLSRQLQCRAGLKPEQLAYHHVTPVAYVQHAGLTIQSLCRHILCLSSDWLQQQTAMGRRAALLAALLALAILAVLPAIWPTTCRAHPAMLPAQSKQALPLSR
jgi:hypothetical protein